MDKLDKKGVIRLGVVIIFIFLLFIIIPQIETISSNENLTPSSNTLSVKSNIVFGGGGAKISSLPSSKNNLINNNISKTSKPQQIQFELATRVDPSDITKIQEISCNKMG